MFEHSNGKVADAVCQAVLVSITFWDDSAHVCQNQAATKLRGEVQAQAARSTLDSLFI